MAEYLKDRENQNCQQNMDDNSPSVTPASVDKPRLPHGPPKLPPLAKRIPRPLTLHNETFIDYYRWMHYIGQDPDVESYIQAESEYTSAWIEQSGIETLQKQLDLEVSQIQSSMARQPKRGHSFLSKPSITASAGDSTQSNSGSSSSHIDAKPKVEQLERTQFWDIDRWRYWLDKTVGDYGVFKRRPIPQDAYQERMETSRRTYMSAQPISESALYHEAGLLSQSFPSQSPFAIPSRPVVRGKKKALGVDMDTNEDMKHKDKVEAIGGCSSERNVSASDVQVVLDINRLVKREKRKGGAGQFSFGSIEIQPQHTSLNPMHSFQQGASKTVGGGAGKEIFLAYTYDVLGDERYHIRVMPLPSTISSKPDPSTLFSTLCALSLTSESERRPSPAAFDFDNWCETLDQGRPIMTLDGNVLKDAGPETRWVKLGQDLFLYFTRLDPKGLQREVWRVMIDSSGTAGNDIWPNPEQHNKTKPRDRPRHPPKLVPELVMRENDERNVLSISQTNDGRFVLIESSGQTNSRTYFLSIDSPEKGWHIIRQAEENVIYKVEHHSGYFYLRTNHNKASNFKVLRIPVEKFLDNSFETLVDTPAEFHKVSDGPATPVQHYVQDEVVLEHDPNEYLERFEVFVEHFVAWIWRGGLQEFRIFQAPRSTEGNNPNPDLPLTELLRVRPYDPDIKVVTVMPGNIRDEEERLFRDFYSTKLRYSNCSFIHPWALYELDMHDLTPLAQMANTKEDDDKIKKATRLVCQEPFPIGVHFGRSAEGSLQDIDLMPKDTEGDQGSEMSRYRELRIMVPSTHGTGNQDADVEDSNAIMIPISVVYYSYPDGDRFPRKAGFVNAYGAYGTMTSALFDPAKTLPLLRRGLVYIQIHPRGDGVMGPSWYTDGKLENKRNTFYDVEDVLLYLRDSGMVEPGGVVVQGRSAGGLVTGWIANRWGEVDQLTPGNSTGGHEEEDAAPAQRGKPKNIVREMVKVVLAQVPFLDVIAGMSDPHIPWVEYEWGSPLQSREIFEVMKAYSPYDRVRNQPYPAMMVMGGLADGRVSYAEPLKFVAKLRSIDGKTNDCQSVEEKLDQGKKRMCAGEKETPLLLQMEDGGHFSGSSSLWMAFALYHLGAEPCTADSYLD
ncbi:hypothetical protein BGZ95_001123 [Linnemannia exigua]|uniref:Prolyl endopeptidase-like n=1 Tax=Linnemannia exigua TaxID=604196 RepID=A0AAD4HA85_9FUNG|nr:hypothetical protein BGZ95_001123 [Linnemannia exigua]